MIFLLFAGRNQSINPSRKHRLRALSEFMVSPPGPLLLFHATKAVCRAKARMKAGVVPQQPPRKVAPASRSSLANPANSSGVVLYVGRPSTIWGRPAFGLIQTGKEHAAARRWQTAMDSRTPTPQFAPMA